MGIQIYNQVGKSLFPRHQNCINLSNKKNNLSIMKFQNYQNWNSFIQYKEIAYLFIKCKFCWYPLKLCKIYNNSKFSLLNHLPLFWLFLFLLLYILSFLLFSIDFFFHLMLPVNSHSVKALSLDSFFMQTLLCWWEQGLSTRNNFKMPARLAWQKFFPLASLFPPPNNELKCGW